MLAGAEALLVACAAALYLYDSALLLYWNEGVLVARGGGRWALALGSSVSLRGREVFLPSPFLPHRPLFRLVWGPEGHASPQESEWTERALALRPLVPLVWTIALAMFVVLPLGLFTRLGDLGVLVAVALVYVNIVTALAWMAWRRARLGVPARRLAAIAFEVLVCSPFALNLVRRLSAEMEVREDLAHAARRLLSPEDWEAGRARLAARIDEELEGEDPNSEFSKKLSLYKAKML